MSRFAKFYEKLVPINIWDLFEKYDEAPSEDVFDNGGAILNPVQQEAVEMEINRFVHID